ncbi:hypothetical protein [Phytohabitans rumicis]|uniref:Uncharacterized protein n=1 Tax=Phytohabitans rumicis TaxID=1076125 RepID=A0A6V8LBQ2_9ACTN|nr:hypothetical protein [Phytohabitans rumicis]GFJ92211.1 hypothetical protein Prum_058530 [Phytohabitans rumicis]
MNVPASDVDVASNATTVSADTVTSAVTAPALFTDPSGVRTWHRGSAGVVNTHDGNLTNRNRCPKFAPYVSVNDV